MYPVYGQVSVKFIVRQRHGITLYLQLETESLKETIACERNYFKAVQKCTGVCFSWDVYDYLEFVGNI